MSTNDIISLFFALIFLAMGIYFNNMINQTEKKTK